MTSSTEALRQIEARHNAASLDWSFECHGGVITLTAVDHGTTDASKVATMFTAHNPADAEFLAAAHGDMGRLIDMVKRAADMINTQKSAENPTPAKTKTPAPASQRAAIAMGYGMFWKFMQEVHGLTFKAGSDKKEQQAAVDDAVRKTLNIASRRELDTDPAAAKRWNSLNNDYWNWKKKR